MKKSKDAYNLVRLEGKDRDAFFERLDHDQFANEASRPLHMNRRTEKRFDYRSHDITITIQHPGGGESSFVILARNISAGGMAFIHGGFIHPTAACTIVMSGRVLEGRVVGCRHVEGLLHEVRVKFKEQIDPAAFLPDESETEPEQPEILSGRVLLVEHVDIDATLFEHHVAETEVKVKRRRDVEEAIEILSEGFDVLILAVPPDAEAVKGHVDRFRDAGFVGATVLLTAETDDARIKATLEAGIEHVLHKPLEREALHELLWTLQREASAPWSDEKIFSTLAKEGLTDMLLQFIDHAEKTAQQLQASIDEQDLEQARAACLNLKGSAGGYGFATLGDAATEALEMIDKTMSMDECSQKIRTLAEMCKRLAVEESKKAS